MTKLTIPEPQERPYSSGLLRRRICTRHDGPHLRVGISRRDNRALQSLHLESSGYKLTLEQRIFIISRYMSEQAYRRAQTDGGLQSLIEREDLEARRNMAELLIDCSQEEAVLTQFGDVLF